VDSDLIEEGEGLVAAAVDVVADEHVLADLEQGEIAERERVADAVPGGVDVREAGEIEPVAGGAHLEIENPRLMAGAEQGKGGRRRRPARSRQLRGRQHRL